MFKRLFLNEKGQDIVEYALLTSLIAIACIVGIQLLAPAIDGVWNNIIAQL